MDGFCYATDTARMLVWRPTRPWADGTYDVLSPTCPRLDEDPGHMVKQCKRIDTLTRGQMEGMPMPRVPDMKIGKAGKAYIGMHLAEAVPVWVAVEKQEKGAWTQEETRVWIDAAYWPAIAADARDAWKCKERPVSSPVAVSGEGWHYILMPVDIRG